MRSVYRKIMSAIGLLFPLQELAVEHKLARRGFRLWLKSLTHFKFIDMTALDLPWWSMRAADYVDQFLALRPDARVFEWGSGASTVWLSRRAREVITLEHHVGWARKVESAVGNNVTVRTVVPISSATKPVARSRRRNHKNLEFLEYVNAIKAPQGAKYDLIVIDGRARPSCLIIAMEHLCQDGAIVFDNALRLRYQTALKRSREHFDVKLLWGLTPGSPYPTVTAVLRRKPQEETERT